MQLVGVPAHIHRCSVGATSWQTGWLHGLSWSEANDLSEVNRAYVELAHSVMTRDSIAIKKE